MQIQKTADNLKRATAKLEQQNKSLAGDFENQRKDLNQQLFTAQQETDKANQQLEDASFEKNDAVAAVQKLQGVIKLVQTEMADAQEAADRARNDLEEERLARIDAEDVVSKLQEQLADVQHAEETARQAAETRLSSLTQEYESMRLKADGNAKEDEQQALQQPAASDAAPLPVESPALKEEEVNADNGGTEFDAEAADSQTPVGAQG
ncbi:hypothetical protein ABBQ38_012898 [Trebouxia sp. C0009 RCD-2024]